MRKLAVTCALSGLLIAGALSGCSSQQAASIGVQLSDGTSFEVTNQTGKDISSVAIKGSGEKNFSEALQQDAAVGESQTATLNCPGAPTDQGKVATQDVQIICTDGSKYVLHDLDLSHLSNVTLFLDAETAYVTYTDAIDGAQVDTLDYENGYIAKKEAEAAAAKKAKEDAKKRAAAKKKAAQKAAAEKEKASKESTQSDSSSTSSSSSSYSSSTSSSSSSSSGSKSSSSSSSAKSSSSSKKSSGSGSSSSSSSSSGSGSSSKGSGSSSTSGSGGSSAADQGSGTSGQDNCTPDL